MLYSAVGLCLSPWLNPISYMGIVELNRKMLGEKKHCLYAGVSFLEMSVKAELKKQKVYSLWRLPDMEPHAAQTKNQEIKKSDFTIMMNKSQNKLHRNFVELFSLMAFQG